MKQVLFILLTALSLSTFAQSTSWTEYKLKEHWRAYGADEIEGVYVREWKSTMYSRNSSRHYSGISESRYYIVKKNGEYIFGELNNIEGGYLTKINAEEFLLNTNILYAHPLKRGTFVTVKILYNDNKLFVDNYVLQLDDDESVKSYDVYTKIIDSEIETNSKKIEPKSGSGFAISSDGIIVTNYHVIENANQIKVRGVNSDFNKTYKAKVLVSDKNNDLVLIQIDDQSFTSLGIPPYKITSNLSDVGNSVFALGYPLRATMGDEVKLTNGIISSKTGFQGDITTYQITVPVQPGNSGGPLFDSNGNIIGIINAKHIGAENASYAIKTSYLMNLIQVMNSSPSLPKTNTISSKNLSEQVKFVKEFVYIIETE